MKFLYAPLFFFALVACAAPGLDSASYSIDMSTPWSRTTIVPGGTVCNGADGTDYRYAGGDLYVTSGCEQSSKVVQAILHNGAWSWSSVGGNTSVEDAKYGDFDEDGLPDPVSAGQNQTIKIHWSGVGADTTLKQGEQQWMALAVADINGDGHDDVIAGGRRAAAPAAHIKLFTNPGASLSHTASAWTETDLGTTGLTISLFAGDYDGDGDTDVLVSEREWIWNGTQHDTSKVGFRWIEHVLGPAPTWIDHMILTPAHGDPKMIQPYDWDGDGDLDVLWTASNVNWNLSGVAVNGGNFGQWSFIDVPQPTGVGQSHAPAGGDVDGDGLRDIVYTYAEAYTSGLSGVVWLRNLGDGSFDRGEISGNDGDKYDDVELLDVDGDGDLDALTSEQHETSPPSDNTEATHGQGLGVVVYLNPSV